MKPITAADLIRILLDFDRQVICPRPSVWGLAAELVAKLSKGVATYRGNTDMLGDWGSIDLSPVRRPAPRGEVSHPTVDRLTGGDVLSVEELVAQRDQLVAACSLALSWVARNTPTVDSADPVLGPVADEADRVRGVLREAIAGVGGRTDAR